MKLEDLCDVFEKLPFPSAHELCHPDEQIVRNARAHVSQAITDDNFLADCFAHELRLIESNRRLGGLTPFFTLPDYGIRFAFGYWSPGAETGPHEHTAWTITGVCRNELEVSTFDREESYRRGELVSKNKFIAQSGMVGHVYSPCIHNPKNISSTRSLSIHIASPQDGKPTADQIDPPAGLIPKGSFPAQSSPQTHPYTSVLQYRQRLRRTRQIVDALVSMNVAQAPDLLRRCYSLTTSSVQRQIERFLSMQSDDPQTASSFVLSWTHPDLKLSYRSEDDKVELCADSARGTMHELTFDEGARDAIAFATRNRHFDIRELPGQLSVEQRQEIGRMLENSGLFKRRRSEQKSENLRKSRGFIVSHQ